MFNGKRFDFRILSVLQLQFPVSKRYSPARRYHALVFRMHGRAEVYMGGEKITLNKNDITFVPADCDYNIHTLTDEQVIVVHFDAELGDTPSLSNLHAPHPDAFVRLFDELLRAWQTRPLGFAYRIDSLFLSILEQIECQKMETRLDALSFCIQRAVDTMHAGFRDAALSIESLADGDGVRELYFACYADGRAAATAYAPGESGTAVILRPTVGSARLKPWRVRECCFIMLNSQKAERI